MRKTIKIGLIALAAMGIGALMWFTLLYHDNDIKKVTVNDSYFTAQIITQVQKEITEGSSFNAAMRSYNTMLQEVGDAAYLENITANEADSCRKLLAYGYAPKLISYAQECFKKNVWNVRVIDTLRHEAQHLIDAGTLPNDSHNLPDLRDIVKTVNDYHHAVAATQVGGITTVAAAQAAISRAGSFKRTPLTNCTNLLSALNAVPDKVKSSLVNNIASACQHSHGANIAALLARIDEYERAFGSNSLLSQQRIQLLEIQQARNPLTQSEYDEDGY